MGDGQTEAQFILDGEWTRHRAVERTLLIACGALARELLFLIERNSWSHISLKCLPAMLHNRPEKISAAVSAAIKANRASYQKIFVVYADCGTGGDLARTCEQLGVGMIPGPHCYAFFEGFDAFAAHDDEITAFYLTDFLTRQFDAFVWHLLGLDRHPALRDVYFGHYTKLVYLAQTDSPDLDGTARCHAARLGLAYERRLTDYGELPEILSRI